MTYATLVEAIATQGGISNETADQVAKYYDAIGVVKYNAHDGYTIRHGGYLDKSTILAALTNAALIRAY